MIGIVARKELRDHLRDRRSVLGALLLPILGPLLCLALIYFLIHLQEERPPRLIVHGREHAPTLMLQLEAEGVEVLAPGVDDDDRVARGDADALLNIDKAFGEKLKKGEPAPLGLTVDTTRTSSLKSVRKLEALLQGYAQQIAAQRLIVRGLLPRIAQPLALFERELSTRQARLASTLSMIPFFLMLAAFIGGMNVAIDTTAGERERLSLEPLLLNPVPRSRLVLGKWLAVFSTTLAVLCVALLGFWFVLTLSPLDQTGLSLNLGLREACAVLAALLPLAMLGSALQLLIASYARTFKEAQTYLNLLNLAPTVPAMLIMLAQRNTETWMMLVPSLAQMTLITDIIKGLAPSPLHLAIAAGTQTALTAACLVGLSRLLQRESVIFGR